jgi:hypothetical protein
MGHVELDLVETDTKSTLGGRDKRRTDSLHIRFGDFARRVPSLAERNGRRRDRRPWIFFRL